MIDAMDIVLWRETQNLSIEENPKKKNRSREEQPKEQLNEEDDERIEFYEVQHLVEETS
jgi:hypothetical protein